MEREGHGESRYEDARRRTVASPEHLWRLLVRRRGAITLSVPREPRSESNQPTGQLQDLFAQMRARVRLIASPDFRLSQYPCLTTAAKDAPDEGWIAWCILAELQAVHAFAKVEPDALEPQVLATVERAKELAAAWIREREQAATGLSFDDRARVGRLIDDVLDGRGTGCVFSGFDAAFPERERLNGLLGIDSPWEIPPASPTPGQLIVKQLREQGFSKDRIRNWFQSDGAAFWDAKAEKVLESLPPINADQETAPLAPVDIAIVRAASVIAAYADLLTRQPCAEGNKVNTGTPNVASGNVAPGVARLEQLRERFCQLLATQPAARSRVIEGYRRYREMVGEWRSENERWEERRRDKLRDLLKKGLIEDPDPNRTHGWNMQAIKGPFPIELVREAEGKEPASLPRSWQHRVAQRALDVMDSQATGTAHSSQSARIAQRLQNGIKKGTHVEYSLTLWLRDPPDTDEPSHPARLTWEAFRQLLPADQLHMAYARLGCLHDVLSLKPIIDPEHERLSIERRGDLTPLIDHDEIYPNEGGSASESSPKLDPRKLDPQFAEALLTLIEEDLRGLQVATAPLEVKAVTPQSSAGEGLAAKTFEHGDDFTWVIWADVKYDFSKGNQADSIRALWQSWERGGRRDGCGLSEKTIGEKCQSASDDFRLAQVFRGHPAFGTMIRAVNKGVFALHSPKAQENPTS